MNRSTCCAEMAEKKPSTRARLKATTGACHDAEVSRRIEGALMRMSTNDRMVLTLRHFSECSYQEIAEILKLDEKTVKSRLFEARQRLRELLADLRTD